MSAFKFLANLLVPHESNNQKAKLIHNSSLVLFAVFAVGFQLLLNTVPKAFPSVLGYAANISPAEVIKLTNEQRIANGLSPLNENKTLDEAALAKGNDMLAKGYWAHFAPDGTSPWKFFINFGYKYQYAGENLARDFSSPSAAVTAWMNSPSHKENILNPHYKEIGIGVVEGSLSGTDTTLIVQFLGSPLVSAPAIPVAKAEDVIASPIATASAKALSEVSIVAATSRPSPLPSPIMPSVRQPVFSPFDTTKNLSLAILGIILLVFSIDLIIVRRKRIFRIGGRTIAHIAYLSMILAVILILRAGKII